MTKLHHIRISIIRVIYLAIVLLTITSCRRPTVSHGGYSSITTSEKIESYNVRITVIDVTTGKPFIGASIVTKKGRNLQIINSNDGIFTFKIPDDKTTWFRTAFVGFYHNEFKIKPDAKYNISGI
jgi:hypothetical protein